ncbi:hypothetical protein [Seonamhaeicola sp. ML3]|uniref:hypothetical protein n=1 Tax=Seonamhaeicola sp. ML3 TaxID=2937786 RepID=UPI00200EE29C|nr:hypothetical protein [Seonamhaeicola sp. ML3]
MVLSITTWNTALIAIKLFNVFNLIREDSFLPLGASIMSFIFTLFILFSYVSLKILPEKVDELLKETYPEYKFL